MVTKTTVPKSAKPRRRKQSHGPNYLIVARDGTMLLASGATGKVRALDPDETKQVLPLLKQRQQAGRQLTEVLETKGFALADDVIINLEV